MILDFLTRYDFPPEAAEALYSAYEKLRRSGSYAVFRTLVSRYETDFNLDFDAVRDTLARIGSETLIHPYTLTTLYLISLTPRLRELYTERGYGAEMYDRSVLDIRWKVMECYNVYGIYGTFVGHWTADFFRLNRFGIGRLEFNPKSFDFDCRAGGCSFAAGDRYIQVHIPSAGPLDHDECTAAYAAAAEFFGDCFSGDAVPFGCKSWLLAPDLQKILPPDSHILRFAADWSIVRNIRDPQNKNLWRIFGCRELPADIDTLPQETGLQQAMAAWLKAGGCIDTAFGVMVLPRG